MIYILLFVLYKVNINQKNNLMVSFVDITRNMKKDIQHHHSK